MGRYLLFALALSVVAPASGQDRIYRATPIDLEQDARLDKLETETAAKFDALTKSIERLSQAIEGKAETLVAKSVLEAPKPIADPVPDASEPSNEPRYCLGDTKYCEGRLHYLACVNGEEKWLPVPTPSIQLATSQPVVLSPTVTYSQPATVQRSVSSRYSTSDLRSLIQQYRNHRIYADVQPRSWAYKHLVQDHGFSSDQVNGLSLDEAYRLHSLAHGGIVKPYRSGQSVAMVQSSVESAPVYSYPVTQTVVNVQPVRTPVRTVVQAASGCPNGQCPTQRSKSGWSLFGRFR